MSMSSQDRADVTSLVGEYQDIVKDYETFAHSLSTLVSRIMEGTSYGIDSVTARAKSVHSLKDKLIRKSYTSLDDVTDKCGLRIVCYYESEVDDIARVLSEQFDVLEDSIHGGAEPDTFGYVSRHLLIRLDVGRLSLPEWEKFETMIAEVQVRSVLQHAWAAISHALAYKSQQEVPEPTRRRLARVAALLETGDEIFDVYRKEISALRDNYRERALGDYWTQLPVDLDSIAAAWQRFPFPQLERAAVDSGWRKPAFDRLYESADYPVGNMDRASRLTRLAGPCHLPTIGSLAEVAERLVSATDWMAKIASSSSGDYVPFAIAPDVLGLALISMNGEVVRTAAIQGRYPYMDRLVKLALSCPLSQSELSSWRGG